MPTSVCARPTRLLLALAAAAAPAAAQSGSVTNLSGQANIFAAGGNAGVGDGVSPLAVTLTAGTGRVLRLSSFSGSVGCAFNAIYNADGVDAAGSPCVARAQVGASNRISGLTFNGETGTTPNGRSIGLVGLFLGSSLPGSTPASLVYGDGQLSYSSASYAAFALGQTFYLGDGLTGTGGGTQQTFAVPDGATTLYFGFIDAPGYNGSPGAYSDNVGSLSFSYAVTPAVTPPMSAVPEPGSVALVATGLAGLGAAARRRRAA